MTATKAKDRSMRYKDGLLSITESGKTDAYRLEAIRNESGETVLGYRCTKLASGDAYDIELSSGECQCMGHLRWGKCRHASAVFTLRNLGLLES